MSTKTQEPALKFNRTKWLLIITLFLSGVVANTYYAAQPTTLRLAVWVVIAVVAGGIGLSTQQGRQAKIFLHEARQELRKVVWPSRQETTRTTIIVVVMVMVAALLLWGIDAMLLNLIGWLTGQRG